MYIHRCIQFHLDFLLSHCFTVENMYCTEAWDLNDKQYFMCVGFVLKIKNTYVATLDLSASLSCSQCGTFHLHMSIKVIVLHTNLVVKTLNEKIKL